MRLIKTKQTERTTYTYTFTDTDEKGKQFIRRQTLRPGEDGVTEMDIHIIDKSEFGKFFFGKDRHMVSKLADEIYSKSIHFKKYNRSNLMFKKNRVLLEKEIYEADKLIESLIFHLHDNPDYSIEYYEMALFMHKTLAECRVYLTGKSKNY